VVNVTVRDAIGGSLCARVAVALSGLPFLARLFWWDGTVERESVYSAVELEAKIARLQATDQSTTTYEVVARLRIANAC